jgi:hypothetical protein
MEISNVFSADIGGEVEWHRRGSEPPPRLAENRDLKVRIILAQGENQ